MNFGYRSLGHLMEDRARRNGDRELLYFEGDTITYADFHLLCNRVAHGFREAGVQPGMRVGLLLWNSPLTLAIWFGLAKIGAWSGFMNPHYKGESLDNLIAKLEPDALVIDHSVHDQTVATPAGSGIDRRFVVPGPDGQVPDGSRSTAELLDLGDERDIDLVTAPDHIAGLIHTSGTTGMPKFCLLSHNYYLAYGGTRIRTLTPRPSDRIHLSMPMYHSHKHFISALLADAAMVVAPRFSVSGYWPHVQATRSTILLLHEQPMMMLLAQEPSPLDRAHGAVIAAPGWRRQREFHDRFGVDLAGSIGTNETGSFAIAPPYRTRMDPTYYDEDAPGQEILADAFEVRVVDADGNEVPTGQTGEITCRAKRPHTIFEGYYNDPERTQSVLRDGWYHLGDLGFLDEDGRLHFMGRRSDSIRHRGEWIPHSLVEDAVRSHPAVRETALVGVPSPLGDEDLKLYVVPDDPDGEPAPEDLLSHVGRLLPYFMVPRYVELVDALPRTPGLEKIRRNELQSRGIGDAWDREAAGYSVRKET